MALKKEQHNSMKFRSEIGSHKNQYQKASNSLLSNSGLETRKYSKTSYIERGIHA